MLGNCPAKLCGLRESEGVGVVTTDADNVSSIGSALMATKDLPNADNVLEECAESAGEARGVELLLLLLLQLLLLLGELKGNGVREGEDVADIVVFDFPTMLIAPFEFFTRSKRSALLEILAIVAAVAVVGVAGGSCCCCCGCCCSCLAMLSVGVNLAGAMLTNGGVGVVVGVALLRCNCCNSLAATAAVVAPVLVGTNGGGVVGVAIAAYLHFPICGCCCCCGEGRF